MVQLNANIKMLLEDAAASQEKVLQGEKQENSAVKISQELEKERIKAENLEYQEEQKKWKRTSTRP